MSISPSLKVLNQIKSEQDYQGSDITLTSIKSLNEDSSWKGPSVGTILTSNGNPALFSSQQNGIVFPPQNVGIQIQFRYDFIQQEKQYSQKGEIYLLVPATGEHKLYGKTLSNSDKPIASNPIPQFNYSITNTSGNSFLVTITL